ncbi:zona pellucida sperm-binding protein 4-like [Stigmatopora argus]
MTKCRGVSVLIAYLLAVCFLRSEVEAQNWQSPNPQQIPPGQNPAFSPVNPVQPVNPLLPWLPGTPGHKLTGAHGVKTPQWHLPGHKPTKWDEQQDHLQKPLPQNPSGFPGNFPHWQGPPIPIDQNPGQNPSLYPGPYPHLWKLPTPGEQNPAHPFLKADLAHDQAVKQGSQILQPGTSQMNINTCDVHTSVRVPCGPPDITGQGCEAINCCYNGGMCHYGKLVTVQCTKDGQFIVVVARDATLPSIDLESLSLLGEGPACSPVDSNSAFAIYQFPVTACGTVVAEESGMIIYENRMTSSYEVAMGPLGAITRDSSFDLLFQARYTGTTEETLIVEVLQIQDPPISVSATGPINVQMRLGNGQCISKGCNEEEVAYNSYYQSTDYPVIRILRDPVYVEVQLMDRSDASLVLNLGRCWTTTTANPHSLPQWDILIDGCPNRDDRYRSSLVAVGLDSGLDFPSHYRRFIFQMFTFVDPSSLEPQKEQIYIHCSTSVCNAGSGFTCEPSCFSRKRRQAKNAVQKLAESKVVVSSGPVQMVRPTE